MHTAHGAYKTRVCLRKFFHRKAPSCRLYVRTLILKFWLKYSLA